MSFIRLKRLAEIIPEPAGRLLACVPFNARLGRAYGSNQRAIARFEDLTSEERRDYIFRSFRNTIVQANRHHPFYTWFYRQSGFRPETLRGFDDIAAVPVTRKADLRQWELSKRTRKTRGAWVSNTGGSSGEPLDFCLSRSILAREWAHMHVAWRRLGYRPTDLKLTFRGKTLGPRPVQYNAVHNEFVVSAVAKYERVMEVMRNILSRCCIRFLHGYPSLLYEFAQYCDDAASDVRDALRATLHGVLLASEYPASHYRDRIDRVFRAPSLSWYGHSEMAVFAYEKWRPFSYTPMHTYGFAEAIGNPDGTYSLVGTTYDNHATPFIRYDTGDAIEPHWTGGILSAFRIASGRVGEFIVDRSGRRLSLTALIFGRHHRAFDVADFVQIRQLVPGKATILLVPRAKPGPTDTWAALFDLTGIDVDFDFECIERPWRTPAGKTPLLIPAHRAEAHA